MEEELGGTFVVAVDELGLNGLWSTIKDLVESRMPLQGLTLPNKVGKPVGVPRLPLMFVLSTDKRLLHLKQYSHSPVTWFRNPMTHLVLVSTADVHEYKSTTRAHLKRVTSDIEKDWGGGAVGSEWLILYVRPFELEAGDKGARKVFEKLCDDFGSKRRERVVRLDVPLRAFDGPAVGGSFGSSSSSSSRMGGGGHHSSSNSSRLAAAGTFVGPGGSALAAGLDDMCAGLRDSIRAAFETRKSAYDAEVRRLHNERREPKWSFTTLYLVKDSFALMLEGAGLWEDAFQEYVELETVYLDCLDSPSPSSSSSSQHSGGVGSHTDFGLTGHDSEDVATLLSSSWRVMRGLVLRKRNVQEFQFRQYLFAAQARVLLRLNRPVDVAERGLVFVQNFLTLLAAKEAAGQLRPWFKECWAFSACMSLITAITTFMSRCSQHQHQQHHYHEQQQQQQAYSTTTSATSDWEVSDILQQGGGPISSAAREALRQLTTATKATTAGAGTAAAAGTGAAAGGGGSSQTHQHYQQQHYQPPGSGPTAPPSSSASSSAVPPVPILPPSAWQLGAVDGTDATTGTGLDAAAAGGAGGGSGSGSAAAAAAVDEDVPPLDLALLCGRAILPANVALLLQEGEQRRELMDKLYCCLLGHLYHLARGELLRLGSALQLPEAAAANASILLLGKAAFSPSKPQQQQQSGAAAAASNSRSPISSRSSSPAGKSQSAASQKQQQQQQQGRQSRNSLTAGVDLLLQASSSGALSPRMVAQLQELLMTPLCGFSMMINKYADGNSNGLTYEVHTPRLEQDPLAAALHRADSQSTPYLSGTAAATHSSPRLTSTTTSAAGVAAGTQGASSAAAAAAPGATPSSPFGRSSGGGAAVTPTAAAGGGGSAASGMLDRLRRVGSSGSVTSSSGAGAAAAAGGGAAAAGAPQSQQSRLSKVTGDHSSSMDDEAAAAAAMEGPGSNGMQRQDSSTSLATVNIGGGPSSSDGAVGGLSFSGMPTTNNNSFQAGDDVVTTGATDDVRLTDSDVICLSGGSVTSGMTAPAAAAAVGEDAGSVADSASSLGAAGQGVRPAHARTQSAADAPTTTSAAAAGAQDLPSLPKVATHARSASALPATTAGEGVAPSSSTLGSPPKAAGQAESSSPDKGLRSRRAAAPTALQPSAATAAAAAAVPGWVGEWRLQLALRSPVCFQELVLALSHRAAWCYAKGGRVRSSALIYADVAVLALQRGQLDAAARLLDRMHHIFASEGWQQLLGVLLPKLLACQSLAAQPMLPFTALRLLALKPGAAAAADRQAAFEELLAAVGATPAGSPSAAAAALGRAVGAGAVWQPTAGLSGGSSSSTVQLATLSAIQMRPAPGTYSHFFGNEALMPLQTDGGVGRSSGSDGDQQQQLVPVLSPPARPVGQQQQQQASHQRRRGAALLVVGDSLPLAVDVISTLPAPVLLQRPMLSLVQLHKSSWVSSSTSGMSSAVGGSLLLPSSSPPSAAAAAGSKGFNKPSTTSAAAGGVGVQNRQQGGGGFAAVWDAIGGGGGGGDRGLLGVDSSPRDPSAGAARWQEGDELLATKLLAAYSPTSPSSSSSHSGCNTINAQQQQQGSSAGIGSCRLLPDGSVLLAPGVNRLVFRVAPVQAGLYCLKQLRALLGSSGELIIGLPPPGSLSLLAAASNLSTTTTSCSSGSGSGRKGEGGAGGGGGGGGAGVTPDPAELPAVAGGAGGSDVVQMGGVTSAGSVVSEVVVARVIEPAPRVTLEPVIPEGCLSVGTSAWLGLLVTPLQGHTLQRPRLHLQPNRYIALAAAAAAGGGGGGGVVGALGAAPGGVRSSIDLQQQQALLGGGGLSASQLTAGSSSSSSLGVSASGHLPPTQQQQQQLGHYVYVVPLQQQQQDAAEAGAAAATSNQQSLLAAASGGDTSITTNSSSSSSVGGQWLPLRRGCVDLAEALQQQPLQQQQSQQQQDGLLLGPLLVWMQVLVGNPQRPQATISVAALPPAPPAAPPPHAGQQQQQQQQPAASAAAAVVLSKVVPQPCVLMASRAANAVADMLLQLEYTADAGVWRSHASSLQVPLLQPVNITATALQLPTRAVAISVTLSLDPGVRTAFVLHQAGLRPQFGLIMGPGFNSSSRVKQQQVHNNNSSSSVGGLLGNDGGCSGSSSSSNVGFSEAVPLVLVPGATAALSFLLLPDPGDKLTGSFEADGCNMLLLSYSTVPYTPPAAITDPSTGKLLPPPPTISSNSSDTACQPAAGGGAGGDSTFVAAAAAGGDRGLAAVGSSSSVGSGAHQAAAAASILAGPAAAAAGSTGSPAGSSVLSLQLPFWLEFPSADDAGPAAASVRVTLLGPQRGRTGQPVTLSWQLARIATAAAAGAADQQVAAGGYSSIPLGDSGEAPGQVGAAAGGSSVGEAAVRQAGATQPQQQQQQHGSSAAESDELLCYELLFGGQQRSAGEAPGGAAADAAGSGGASSSMSQGSKASGAAAAAVAADMGGVSSSSNAALFWGVSGAAPSGVVRLGRAPGSLAVVEVVLCPRGAGRVAAPQLLLKSPGGTQLVLLEGDTGHSGLLTISRE